MADATQPDLLTSLRYVDFYNQPLFAPSAFPLADTFCLAGFTFPGKWTLTDAKKKFGWQIQKGNGLDGATCTPTGVELIVVKFNGQLWDSGDCSVFKQLRKSLLAQATLVVPGVGLNAALGIIHPELAALGVTSVVIQELTPLIDSGGGLWTTSLELLQYRKPKPTQKKADYVIPGKTAPQPTAVSRSQIEIQKFRAEKETAAAQKLKL